MAQTKTDSTPLRTFGRGRRISFYVAVGLTLAAVAAYPPLLIGPVVAWLDESVINSLFGEEGLGIHRVHLVGTSLLFWLTIVAMVSQFRTPQTKAAPLWAAAAAWAFFLPLELTHLIDPYSVVVAVLVLAVLALHPRRWPDTGIAWPNRARMPAIVGAIVGVVYATGQAVLQISGIAEDPHVPASHYALMAAMAVGLSVSTLAGATNFPGSRISAWTVGIMTVVLGVFFMGHPHQASSAGVGWGLALIAWGVVHLWATTKATRSAQVETTATG